MLKLGPLLIFPAAEKAASTGRPSLRTPERVAKICAAIRGNGHTDTHAAALAGVSSSAVSRWRQEDEEFALQLDAARAEYLDARLSEIREVCKRDGSPDWRARAWLMQVVAPEAYGTPSRRFSLAREKEEQKRREENAEADDPNVLSMADQAHCQQWRAYSIHTMNGMGEEEARWRGHFLHHANPPVFPGSLAIAGAEIPPPPKLSPEEEAKWAATRERRRVALLARDRSEPGQQPATRDGEAMERDGTPVTPGDATHGLEENGNEPGRPRPEDQNGANCPETPPGRENATNLPETGAPAKRTATWVQVPPVQLDGSAPKTVPTASPRGGVESRHGVEPAGRNNHMNHRGGSVRDKWRPGRTGRAIDEPRKDTSGSRASEFLAKAAEFSPRPTVEGGDNGPAGSAWATCQEVLCG